GPDEYDSTVSRQPVPRYSEALNNGRRDYKIGYLREIDHAEGIQPEIKENIKAKVRQLKDAGYAVEPVAFPLMEYILPTYYILAAAEASSNLSRFDGVRYGYRSKATVDLESMYKKSRSEGFGKEV